jgi:hypothetical protein
MARVLMAAGEVGLDRSRLRWPLHACSRRRGCCGVAKEQGVWLLQGYEAAKAATSLASFPSCPIITAGVWQVLPIRGDNRHASSILVSPCQPALAQPLARLHIPMTRHLRSGTGNEVRRAQH